MLTDYFAYLVVLDHSVYMKKFFGCCFQAKTVALQQPDVFMACCCSKLHCDGCEVGSWRLKAPCAFYH